MKISRKFTTAGSDPFASVKWVKRSSKISNPDGSIVFKMDDAEVPESWSQLATDIMVSKYFRKAGVPANGGPNGIKTDSGASGTATLRVASESSGNPSHAERGGTQTVGEHSAKQVIHRLAGCWKHWGEKHGYFDSPADAQAFYDELCHMLVHQMAAPNSPQWFNTGLNWAYGISGPAQGHFVPDPKTGKVGLAKDAYTHPQPHACFIQSVDDDLVNEGGIMDLWVREARLFKYGSGTGTNFSRLRAENENLSGGGKSSGLMSWLKIGDRAAGAIKSGGTTRRAAKMVCLDMDHPDIQTFINWKVREEIKVQALVEGFKAIAAKKSSAGDNMTIGETAKKLGLKLDYDFNGEAYLTVSGQNSNNSVRIPDAFFDAVDQDADWQTFARTSGKMMRTFKARELWSDIAYAAWRCADPGVQFDSTINAWHTCPNGGRINASNPCSEYMFLDNTACNLASLNVLKFYNTQTRAFDVASYEHAIDLWTIVLEISVLMASYPSSEVARLSYKYRTLGLGYANLGAMLMQAGIPYDSEEGRAVCATLTAILTGRAYRMSATMAAQLGAFAGYESDKQNMLRVIRNHRLAAHGVPRDSGHYDNLRIAPVPTDHAVINAGRVKIANADDLLDASVRAWDEALLAGEKHGYRNAQVTVIAPTGTIGLLMDCDTTGIEPDFALVKFKKLAGGGYFKIANASVEPALHAMGYSPAETRDILNHLLGTLTLDVAMPDPGTATLRVASESGAIGTHAERGGTQNQAQSFKQFLLSKGLTEAELAKIEASLPGVFELSFAFSAWSLGDDALSRLGFDPAAVKADFKFNLLRELGLNKTQISALNDVICGTQTVEGAPHLKPAHVAVFDCANKCGKYGQRFIAAEGHIRMMAAAQPFISGAISKTINLPSDAKVDDITSCYRLSWELGLKANALYRDGCKLSQPLSSTVEESEDDVKETSAGKASAAVPTLSPTIEAKPASLNPQLNPQTSPAPAKTAVPTPAPSTPVEAPAFFAAAAAQQPQVEVRIVERPMRRRLPDTRASVTHKFNIGGHEGYLTVGLYEDGMPGELFITMAKEGSTIGGLMDSLGTAVSVALQYGVPVESLINKFTHQRFEPAGMTANRDIPFAKSLVDYIFRWMGMEFIAGYREANAPKRHDSQDHQPMPAMGEDAEVALGALGKRIAHIDAELLGESDADAESSEDSVTEDTQPWNAHQHPSRTPRVQPDAHAHSHAHTQCEKGQCEKGKMTPGQSRECCESSAGAQAHSPSRSHQHAPGGGVGAGVGHAAPATSAHSSAVPMMRTSVHRTHTSGLAAGDGDAQTVVDVDRVTVTRTHVHTTSKAGGHKSSGAMSALSAAMKSNQEDAPACDVCGSITVRSGTCYKCLNCGASMGCS